MDVTLVRIFLNCYVSFFFFIRVEFWISNFFFYISNKL